MSSKVASRWADTTLKILTQDWFCLLVLNISTPALFTWRRQKKTHYGDQVAATLLMIFQKVPLFSKSNASSIEWFCSPFSAGYLLKEKMVDSWTSKTTSSVFKTFYGASLNSLQLVMNINISWCIFSVNLTKLNCWRVRGSAATSSRMPGWSSATLKYPTTTSMKA